MTSSPREPQEVPEGPAQVGPSEDFRSSEKRPKISIPLLLFNDADTLCYIDSAPESQPRTIAPPPDIPHRVHSERLLSTGSAYFHRLFSQRCQNRVRKQRRYAEKLPDGIKYLVDLTPAMLEDDAVITLTEVSCPTAILTWASYKYVWKLPESCVGGEDELEFTGAPKREDFSGPLVLRNESETSEDDNQDIDDDTAFSAWHDENTESRRTRSNRPVEYSAARHREGIEHVLHVLEGLNISLDTPCKLWTFFAVAKLYDVATVPAISGYVISWFYEKQNTRFIELHPEIAYRVACGIKSPTLCRDAFVHLVSDEAFLHIIRSARLKPIRKYKSSFTNSRMKDLLDDTEIQRIEYASKAFADDIINHFLHLAGGEMTWLADIPEFAKITQHASQYPEDTAVVHFLVTCLKDTIRNGIYRILSQGGDPVRFCDAVPSEQPNPYFRTFLSRDMLVRLMGKWFWSALAGCQTYLSNPGTSLGAASNEHQTIAEVGCGLIAFQGQENASVLGVPKETLVSRVEDFNELAEYRAKQVQANIEKARILRDLEDQQRRNLALNLRRQLQLDGEGLLFPIGTALPERPARRTETDSSLSGLPQEQPSGPKFPIDILNPVTGNGVQANIRKDSPAFNLEIFIESAGAYISSYSRALVYANDSFPFSKDATNLLTCLSDNEWKYLPLWAGGNDDETGGVFTDHGIPIADTGGFSAPGPSVHTGSTRSTDDSFSDINGSDFQSTIQGASHHATYSHTSEILSMHSFEEVEYDKGLEIPPNQSSRPTPLGDNLDMSSVHSDSEDDFGVQSTGASTITMGSPSLSGFSDDDDVDMDISEDEFALT